MNKPNFFTNESIELKVSPMQLAVINYALELYLKIQPEVIAAAIDKPGDAGFYSRQKVVAVSAYHKIQSIDANSRKDAAKFSSPDDWGDAIKHYTKSGLEIALDMLAEGIIERKGTDEIFKKPTEEGGE